MYYTTLGNLSYYTNDFPIVIVEGGGLTNTGPFNNLLKSTELTGYDAQNAYWLGTLVPVPGISTEFVASFEFSLGTQFYTSSGDYQHVWAVHDGDIGTAVVPISATIYLFGSGLLGLIGIARNKAA